MGCSPVGTLRARAASLVSHAHREAALIRARIGVDAETNQVDPGWDKVSTLVSTVPEDQLWTIELT